MSTKTKKMKEYVIEISSTSIQYRYYNAPSAKAALKAYENGDPDDMEYDYDERSPDEKVLSIKKLKSSTGTKE